MRTETTGTPCARAPARRRFAAAISAGAAEIVLGDAEADAAVLVQDLVLIMQSQEDCGHGDPDLELASFETPPSAAPQDEVDC
jgi:hypothetical protein